MTGSEAGGTGLTTGGRLAPCPPRRSLKGMDTTSLLSDHRPSPTVPTGAEAATTSRLEALDLVRLLAIVGMMATHLLLPVSMAPDAAGPEAVAAQISSVLAEGTSSTLFAVVGGCSLVLASRQRLEAGDRREAVLARLRRAARVMSSGRLLETGPITVPVVLEHVGRGRLAEAPLLLVTSPSLVVLAAVLTLVG